MILNFVLQIIYWGRILLNALQLVVGADRVFRKAKRLYV